jgi:hypothetical protein
MKPGMQADATARSVIFVGGTSYSGSTLLDMILANDPTGLSCGEVYALFYPYRRHHLDIDTLGMAIDWKGIRAAGPTNLYRSLFDRFPECRFIVDSSKSPLWIADRSAELKAQGIRSENVLVWKSPAEFRASRRKRGREQGWEREWLNYHRYYFTLVKNWRSVRYRDLVTEKTVLKQLCTSLSIPYFDGKEQYWNREQHTVFGNDTTKIHLHERSSTQYENVKSAIDSDFEQPGLSQHRTVSYDPTAPTDELLPDDEPSAFTQILDVLEHYDIGSDACQRDVPRPDADALRTGKLFHAYQFVKLKYGLHWVVAAIRQ